MNLQQLRDYVRAQLDIDEEELPNALVDTYLSEAYLRTISMENRWPFLEDRWNVTAFDDNIALPDTVDPSGIAALVDQTSGYRLIQIGNELAEDFFIAGWSTASHPSHYTLYGGGITLWPTPPDDYTRGYTLRGQRLPVDWIAGGASAVPDCDVRLHQLLAHYAIALTYAAQEDEVLEDTYMKRWQASYVAAHNAICQPRHHRPVVFNGGMLAYPAANPVLWASPPVHP